MTAARVLEEIGRAARFDADVDASHEAAWRALMFETDCLITVLRTVHI